MKTSFKILSLLFISTLSLTSCSSSDSGESNGTTTGDYFPMAVNNKWNYTNGSEATEATLTGTTNFGSATYYEMEDTSAELDIQLWMAKKGASYYQKSATSTIIQNGTAITMEGYEAKIFRDDLAVGESWHGSASPKVTYSGGSFRAQISYDGTITAKGVTETIEGVIYNDIIKMELEAVVNSNGQINYISTEYWFAKDVGLVKEVETSTVDNITKTRYLTSYDLH